MRGTGIRITLTHPGKVYHAVRCWTDEEYPWHQCIKYFPKRATDDELQATLKEFITELE